MEPLTLLQIGIITLIGFTVMTVLLCAWAYAAGLQRGRGSSARELDKLATSLRLNASSWRLAADERPYVEIERNAFVTMHQDRSRVAIRGRETDVVWVGDGVAVGDQIAAVCVETGPQGRRMSTMLLAVDGDEMRGVRLTVSKKKGAALIHPIRLIKRD